MKKKKKKGNLEANHCIIHSIQNDLQKRTNLSTKDSLVVYTRYTSKRGQLLYKGQKAGSNYLEVAIVNVHSTVIIDHDCLGVHVPMKTWSRTISWEFFFSIL